eukprot:NODE_750_length_4577_cov_0.299687.p2 type:complete len:326 gc:universal NODE_750_length_4577_cov_0.299687:1358-381(-)
MQLGLLLFGSATHAVVFESALQEPIRILIEKSGIPVGQIMEENGRHMECIYSGSGTCESWGPLSPGYLELAAGVNSLAKEHGIVLPGGGPSDRSGGSVLKKRQMHDSQRDVENPDPAPAPVSVSHTTHGTATKRRQKWRFERPNTICGSTCEYDSNFCFFSRWVSSFLLFLGVLTSCSVLLRKQCENINIAHQENRKGCSFALVGCDEAMKKEIFPEACVAYNGQTGGDRSCQRSLLGPYLEKHFNTDTGEIFGSEIEREIISRYCTVEALGEYQLGDPVCQQGVDEINRMAKVKEGLYAGTALGGMLLFTYFVVICLWGCHDDD